MTYLDDIYDMFQAQKKSIDDIVSITPQGHNPENVKNYLHLTYDDDFENAQNVEKRHAYKEAFKVHALRCVNIENTEWLKRKHKRALQLLPQSFLKNIDFYMSLSRGIPVRFISLTVPFFHSDDDATINYQRVNSENVLALSFEDDTAISDTFFNIFGMSYISDPIGLALLAYTEYNCMYHADNKNERDYYLKILTSYLGFIGSSGFFKRTYKIDNDDPRRKTIELVDRIVSYYPHLIKIGTLEPKEQFSNDS